MMLKMGPGWACGEGNHENEVKKHGFSAALWPLWEFAVI